MQLQTICATFLLGVLAPMYWHEALQASDRAANPDLPEDIRRSARRQIKVSTVMAVVSATGAAASTICLAFFPAKH